MATLIEGLRSAYAKYEDALAKINAPEYFRIGTMDKTAWNNYYGGLTNLKNYYLPMAKKAISDYRKGISPYSYDVGANLMVYNPNFEDAPKVASFLVDALEPKNPSLGGLDGSKVGQWTDNDWNLLSAAIDGLIEDVGSVANTIKGYREEYLESGEQLGQGETPESVLSVHSDKLKGNLLYDYLNELPKRYGNEGIKYYNKLVWCANKVMGARDSSGNVKPNALFEYPWLSDAQKVAYRILRYNYGAENKRNTRAQETRNRDVELQRLGGTMGLTAANTIQGLQEGEEASPRSLAASALHVNHSIYNITRNLKERTRLSAELDSALVSGDMASIEGLLFSSIGADARDSIGKAKEILSLRESAQLLAGHVRRMKQQDYNLYMDFLRYYLNADEDDDMGVSPYWEDSSMIDKLVDIVDGWMGSRRNSQASLSDRAAMRGAPASAVRAFRLVEENVPPIPQEELR